ncbi:MAG: hypothetical protein LBQ70_02435, partial [Prevotellaceae bacterium]|nr:hypothetical protein [Prevotellaceae bacterium]
MKINLSAASCPVILYCLFVLLSCERENPVEKQEERIESYIRTKMSKNPGLKLSQDDRVFYLYEPGDTATGVAAGDSVYFYYAGT